MFVVCNLAKSCVGDKLKIIGGLCRKAFQIDFLQVMCAWFVQAGMVYVSICVWYQLLGTPARVGNMILKTVTTVMCQAVKAVN